MDPPTSEALAETRRRIFEPFFTTKPRDRGTGPGLATVYGVVEQSGGHIWVYSEPGRGTKFKFYFPQFTGAEAEAPRRPDAPKASRGTETVLLFEDGDLVHRAARSVLERRGYAVLEASTPAEALALAEQDGAAAQHGVLEFTPEPLARKVRRTSDGG